MEQLLVRTLNNQERDVRLPVKMSRRNTINVSSVNKSIHLNATTPHSYVYFRCKSVHLSRPVAIYLQQQQQTFDITVFPEQDLANYSSLFVRPSASVSFFDNNIRAPARRADYAKKPISSFPSKCFEQMN